MGIERETNSKKLGCTYSGDNISDFKLNTLETMSENYSISLKKKKFYKNIGLVYNQRPNDSLLDSDDLALEYDEPETIDAIKKSIESAGYNVFLLEADQNFSEKIKLQQIDFVFNIAEGIQGESRESHIPAILEMMGIPYSGSGVLTQAITLSKTRTKEILDYYNIPTANFQKFYDLNQKLNSKLKFPLIIKPDAEGSSVGITNDSVVHNNKELYQQIDFVLNRFSGPVLVEEFCPGREFTVGILGNNPPTILPIIEVTFNHLPKNVEKIDSYESKWIFDVPGMKVDPLVCPAPMSIKLFEKIKKIALETYFILGCVDFCRMDIRLDKNGNPKVLEINALPGINPNPSFHSRFPYACSKAGIQYKDMVLEILHSGMERYQPNYSKLSALSKMNTGFLKKLSTQNAQRKTVKMIYP
ncbi:D-alanine--D-alanine ligase [Candidatus Lokiarchaeum ossiferum]|uniref:D-alanine--D-alanine ligase n=1 Tax=Candidatus Lokiarchaeum ossiferum TaxID=2951803 RepID=UPI00352BD57C